MTPISVPAGTTDDAVSTAADRVGTRGYGDDAAISGAATWLRAYVRGDAQAPPDRATREWVDKIVAELHAMAGDAQFASLFGTSVSMATPSGTAGAGDAQTLPPVDAGPAEQPATTNPTPAPEPTEPQQPPPTPAPPAAGDDLRGTVAIYDDDDDDGPEVVITGTRASFGQLSPRRFVSMSEWSGPASIR